MSIAVAAILALVTALIGPYFIDWSAYRTEIEGQATRLLGARVRVLGDADLRLLPTPTIVLADVRLGPDGDPVASAARVFAEIELAPLLRGEVEVTALEIGSPVLRLALDADGRVGDLGLSADPAALDPAGVALEKVTITDGTIELDDGRPGGPLRVGDIDMTLEARSLLGPFKADGTANLAGLQSRFRVATGAADGSGVFKVQTELWPALWPAVVTADGTVTSPDGVPVYEGTVSAVRVLPPQADGAPPPEEAPARGEGRFRFDARGFSMQNLAVSYGPPDRAVGLTGVLEIPFEAGAGFAAALSARQIELDRMAGGSVDAPPPPSEALASLIGVLAGAPAPPIPGRVTLDASAVVAGGGVIQDVRMSAATRPDGWHVDTLEAVLPGRSALSLSGDLSTRASPSFDGRVRLSSEQPGVLAGWWRSVSARSAAPGQLDVSADVRASAGGLDLSDLTIANDGRALSGGFAWRPSSDGGRGGVDLELAGERLDVDALTTLSSLVSGASPAGLIATVDGDLSLRLRADEVSVRGFTGRGLDLVAAHADGALTIERLRLDDLAGAAVDASGRIADLAAAPSGTITAKLGAQRLDGIAALVAELAPGTAFAEAFARAAPSLSPADLTADIAAAPDEAGVSATLTLRGSAGGAQIGVTGSFEGDVAAWRAGSYEIAATASGVDGVRLLGQLGVPVLPIAAGGDGRLSLTATGRPVDGLAVALDLEAGPSRLDVEGRVRLPETGPVESNLEVALSSPDLTDVALALGRIVPLFAGGLPVELYGRIEGLGTGLSLQGVTGSVSGVRVSGNGALDLSGRRPRLTGDLAIAETDLVSLAEFGLGADAFTPVGGEAGWSQRAFSPGLADGLDASLTLAIDRLGIGAFPVSGVRGRLRLDQDGMRLSELSGGFAGGRLDGAVTVAQDGGAATVRGRIAVTNADLSSLVWQRDGAAVATGTLDAALELEGHGRSAAATVATLSGNGSFSIRNGTIAAVDPAAFTTTLAAADTGLKLDEPSVRRVFEENFAAGRLVFGDLSGSVTVAAGVLRLPSLVVGTPEAELRGTASVDLAAQTLSADWTLSVAAGERDLKGVFPAASLRFSGPIAAPERALDVTPLVAFLTLRESEREARRVEALEAEVLELQRHDRELRGLREQGERRRREAEEAARRAEEERLRAEEEARLRAEEEARRVAEEEAARQQAEEDRLALERLVREAEERQRALERAPDAAPPLQLVPSLQ
jgi:uncharacterized protein involved in outer membrane biogenesis